MGGRGTACRFSRSCSLCAHARGAGATVAELSHVCAVQKNKEMSMSAIKCHTSSTGVSGRILGLGEEQGEYRIPQTPGETAYVILVSHRSCTILSAESYPRCRRSCTPFSFKKKIGSMRLAGGRRSGRAEVQDQMLCSRGATGRPRTRKAQLPTERASCQLTQDNGE
jgi:hypothetical protein